MLCEYSISARVGAIRTCFRVGPVKTWLWDGVKRVTGRTLLPERVATGGGDGALSGSWDRSITSISRCAAAREASQKESIGVRPKVG